MCTCQGRARECGVDRESLMLGRPSFNDCSSNDPRIDTLYVHVCVFILHPIVLSKVSYKRRVPNQGRSVHVVQKLVAEHG